MTRRPWPPPPENDGVLRLTWYLCSHCSQRLKTRPVWRNGCAVDEPDACTCAGAVLARIADAAHAAHLKAGDDT